MSLSARLDTALKITDAPSWTASDVSLGLPSRIDFQGELRESGVDPSARFSSLYGCQELRLCVLHFHSFGAESPCSALRC